VFAASKDIPDKPELRLVVLDPDHGHKRKDDSSKAVRGAEDVLKSHGDKPREYQNRLLFLVPDVNAVQPLRDNVRRYLAWQSIVEDADQLNLDKHHEKEAAKSLAEATARVDASVREAYRILLAPMAEAEAVGTVVWEDEALNLSGSNYDKAIAATTKEREWVISGWAPTHLATLLARWFWKDGKPDVVAKKVWLDTCRYLYLPRLASEDVFVSTVRDGVSQHEWFGYAASAKDGAYQGVIFGHPGSVYLDDSSVLLHPDAANAAVTKPASEPPPEVIADDFSLTTPKAPKKGPGRGGSVPAGPVYKRFHATVEVTPSDPIGSFTDVVENVIQHFAAQYGTVVAVTVDIEAERPDGFDDKTVRVVKENATTLKFKSAEFETE
jgi:hypothetical protein